MSNPNPFEVVGELTYDPAADTLRRVTFTEGWVGDPRPSARSRRLTPNEELVLADGWSQVPLNDPIIPERVIKALLSIAGTVGALLEHERQISQLCWEHTRNGDGS